MSRRAAVAAALLLVVSCREASDARLAETQVAAASATESVRESDVQPAFELYLAENGIVYGNIAIPVGTVIVPMREGDVGRDALAVFSERAAPKLKAAIDQGLFSVRFDTVQQNFLMNRREIVYQVEPTATGRSYLKAEVPDWRMAYFRIANRELESVTGVVSLSPNEAKMYCHVVTTKYTPFRDWVAQADLPNEGSDLTVFLIKDARAWKVARVEKGTV
ncbi:MAG: hypothetical protein M3Q69_02030 [Acidobacteriota bacterium]|nr:hypothetical protein [Acidobacteriota bacterium]